MIFWRRSSTKNQTNSDGSKVEEKDDEEFVVNGTLVCICVVGAVVILGPAGGGAALLKMAAGKAVAAKVAAKVGVAALA